MLQHEKQGHDKFPSFFNKLCRDRTSSVAIIGLCINFMLPCPVKSLLRQNFSLTYKTVLRQRLYCRDQRFVSPNFYNFILPSNSVNHPQFSSIMQFMLVKTYIATIILNIIMNNNLISIKILNKAFKQSAHESCLIIWALKSSTFSNFNYALLSKNKLRELELLPLVVIFCIIFFETVCFLIKFFLNLASLS